MKIGYARVSTDDQNLAMQLDALRAAGCEVILAGKREAAKQVRPDFKPVKPPLSLGRNDLHQLGGLKVMHCLHGLRPGTLWLLLPEWRGQVKAIALGAGSKRADRCFHSALIAP